MRVPDDLLARLIRHDGFTPDGVTSPNATGVLRLALDLREARAEIKRLREKLAQAICDEQSSTEALVSALAEIERLEGLIYDDFYTAGGFSPAFYAIKDEAERIAKKREGK